MARARLGVLLLAATCAALVPVVARADGDPASDYLLGQNVFLPFGVKMPASSVEQLSTIVQEATAAGYKIRVAVIATKPDLGSIPQLYRKPQEYSQFLGQELAFVYRGRLLVVMPNGYGFAVTGKATPKVKRALVGLPPPSTAPNLADAATTAVQRLAAAGGHPVALPKSHGDSSTSRDRIVIAVVAVAAVAAAIGIAALRRSRRGTARRA
ncbi:MAG TPA: hypothetical protein VEH52_01735 [Gaiellaceae bacterium]|nr:hypothetical protein [Gaiellaceae bacterium]